VIHASHTPTISITSQSTSRCLRRRLPCAALRPVLPMSAPLPPLATSRQETHPPPAAARLCLHRRHSRPASRPYGPGPRNLLRMHCMRVPRPACKLFRPRTYRRSLPARPKAVNPTAKVLHSFPQILETRYYRHQLMACYLSFIFSFKTSACP